MLMRQIVIFCEVKILPVYFPSAEEQSDPSLFAANVQKVSFVSSSDCSFDSSMARGRKLNERTKQRKWRKNSKFPPLPSLATTKSSTIDSSLEALWGGTILPWGRNPFCLPFEPITKWNEWMNELQNEWMNELQEKKRGEENAFTTIFMTKVKRRAAFWVWETGRGGKEGGRGGREGVRRRRHQRRDCDDR